MKLSQIKTFTLILLALVVPSGAQAASFNASDVLVLQIGDTTPGDPGNQTVPVQIVEYQPTAFQLSPVQSLAMPTSASGASHALTLQNNRAGGGLNLTGDGRYIVFGGTDVAPRTTTPTPTVRTIGRVDSQGTIDTTTSFNNAFVGSTRIGIRSVASADGSSFYLAGNGDNANGVHYETLGGSSATPLADTASRHVAIFGGNLYLAKDASVNQIGAGLPLPIDAPSVTLLNGVGGPPAGGNWNSPVFFDLDPLIAGPDTLYLGVQRSNSVELPAIVKYTFNGTTWTQTNTFDFGNLIGMLFLTGRVEGGSVVLYGTTDNGGAPTFGNSLVRMVDTGAGSTFTTLATADATHGFRGVSLAPVPEPTTLILLALGMIAVPLIARRKRATAPAKSLS